MMMWALVGCFLVVAWLMIRKRNIHLKSNNHKQLLIILGSGGHTTEMCMLLKKFNFNSAVRINIVIGYTDRSSQLFFTQYFKIHNPGLNLDKIRFYYTSRTNEVKQFFLFAVVTTFFASIRIFFRVIKSFVSVTDVIANGPGICVPFYYSFFLLKILRLSKAQLIFFQSWCRVDTLSLTGKLIKPISNQFIVHWESQSLKFKGCKYYGQLV